LKVGAKLSDSQPLTTSKRFYSDNRRFRPKGGRLSFVKEMSNRRTEISRERQEVWRKGTSDPEPRNWEFDEVFLGFRRR